MEVSILEAPEQLAWSDNYTNLAGKYTCRSIYASTCTELYYLAGTELYYMYYLELNNGKRVEDEMITFSDSITDNGDGTYTLSNPVTIEKKDWYTNYGSYTITKCYHRIPGKRIPILKFYILFNTFK